MAEAPITVTILTGATGLSTVVDLWRGGSNEYYDPVPISIKMPATWVAADLTFRSGDAEDSLENVYSADDTEFTVQAAASRTIKIEPKDAVGFMRYLQIRSGTSAVPVNQTATRTLKVKTMDL